MLESSLCKISSSETSRSERLAFVYRKSHFGSWNGRPDQTASAKSSSARIRSTNTRSTNKRRFLGQRSDRWGTSASPTTPRISGYAIKTSGAWPDSAAAQPVSLFNGIETPNILESALTESTLAGHRIALSTGQKKPSTQTKPVVCRLSQLNAISWLKASCSPDAKNSWMLEAVSRLAPDYGRSKEILVALHDLHTDVSHEPRWVVEPPMFALDTRPNIATMFRDLSALCDDKWCLTDASFCDAAHGHPVKDADVPTFIASIIGSTFSPPLPDEEPLLAAINFVPSPATPMGLIQYNMTPMPYGRDPAYQLEKNQGQIKWSTTIAPAGALTDIQPELDECIRYIVHIGGRSLWIIWPSTDYNLFIMAHNNPSTLGALDQLQGMEVFIVEQRLDHFIIPPSHYYACLALTPSFYSCSRIWPPK
ncbi:hypothetical protein H0H87_001825 [Tephrocybe sp. NHM501043]|nr:hypothetical protein H0H87_001825 [Tephrocybe sp. NHM501043]